MLNTKENLNPINDHKSALNNPNVSEAKRHAQAVGDDKDLARVAAVPKDAQHIPGRINLGKMKAYEELIRKGGETPEE